MICPYCTNEIEPVELNGKTFCPNCGMITNSVFVSPKINEEKKIIQTKNNILSNNSIDVPKADVFNAKPNQKTINTAVNPPTLNITANQDQANPTTQSTDKMNDIVPESNLDQEETKEFKPVNVDLTGMPNNQSDTADEPLTSSALASQQADNEPEKIIEDSSLFETDIEQDASSPNPQAVNQTEEKSSLDLNQEGINENKQVRKEPLEVPVKLRIKPNLPQKKLTSVSSPPKSEVNKKSKRDTPSVLLDILNDKEVGQKDGQKIEAMEAMEASKELIDRVSFPEEKNKETNSTPFSKKAVSKIDMPNINDNIHALKPNKNEASLNVPLEVDKNDHNMTPEEVLNSFINATESEGKGRPEKSPSSEQTNKASDPKTLSETTKKNLNTKLLHNDQELGAKNRGYHKQSALKDYFSNMFLKKN